MASPKTRPDSAPLRAARGAWSWPCRAASIPRSWRRCSSSRATTSSASPCSSTTTARPSAGAGPAAPGQDIHDARRVADRLGIPHYVLDYEQRFKATVMQSFADSYVAGETPIPCVVCNQQIKFHELLATARELEADALATGHYIELRDGPGGPELYRARDAERDQSYFLFATTRAQLDSLMFPLGGLRQGRGARAGAQLRPARRRQVRQPGHLLRAAGPLHQRHRAPEARRRRGRRHRARRRPRARPPRRHHQLHHRPAPRPRHPRAARRSTSCASMRQRKQVVVGPRESLHAHWITLRNVNWLGDEPIPAGGMSVAVRVRSTSPPQPATLFPSATAPGCCCATANTASPPARPACSMPMPARERACWAEDGSSAR